MVGDFSQTDIACKQKNWIMKIIAKYVYQLFIKHGFECLWESDSKVPRPEGTSLETDEMFEVLERVDHRFKMIATGKYSTKMVNNIEREIEELKPKMSKEVFKIMANKYF